MYIPSLLGLPVGNDTQKRVKLHAYAPFKLSTFLV